MSTNLFDRISFWSLFAVIVLLPIFFLPFTSIPIETSKGLLLVIGLTISLISWAFARFSDGKISLPRSSLLLAAGGVLLVVLLSAIFSGSTKSDWFGPIQTSFFGTMFDVGTFWFLLSAFVLMFMCSVVFSERDNAKMVLLGTLLSSTLLFIFQFLHAFFPILSFGVLGGKTSNLFGSWNALGLFAAFTAVISLIVIEFFSTTKVLKLFLQGLIIISLVMTTMVNFHLIWILLGVFSLIIFVYKVSISYYKKEENKKITFPIFSFIVVTVSILFLISGQLIGGVLPGKLGLANTEVGPSFGSTMAVTKSVLKNHPILGLGPNRFAEAWALYKPAQVNSTGFWDVAFTSGSGLLPTFLATGGILGILAWLIFFGLFILSGVRALSSSRKEVNLDLVAFFVMCLFLFITSFVYFTGVVITLLAFAFTGIFVGIYTSADPEGKITISFLHDPRRSFFFIFFLIFVIIGSVAISFKYSERLVSIVYFSRAVSAQSSEVAESSIGKALALYQNDLYLRTYSQVYTVRLNSIAAKVTTLSEGDKTLLQSSFNQAVNGAQAAINYDPENYLNHRSLAAVYQNAAALGVKDAATSALTAYKNALLLSPLNPGLELGRARVSLRANKLADAKGYANAALALKPNYVDALLTLSQIAKMEGNTSDAISYATRAQEIVPSNKDIAAYIDSLRKGTVSTPPETTTEEGSDTKAP
jgi:hypothetical protein